MHARTRPLVPPSIQSKLMNSFRYVFLLPASKFFKPAGRRLPYSPSLCSMPLGSVSSSCFSFFFFFFSSSSSWPSAICLELALKCFDDQRTKLHPSSWEPFLSCSRQAQKKLFARVVWEVTEKKKTYKLQIGYLEKLLITFLRKFRVFGQGKILEIKAVGFVPVERGPFLKVANQTRKLKHFKKNLPLFIREKST